MQLSQSELDANNSREKIRRIVLLLTEQLVRGIRASTIAESLASDRNQRYIICARQFFEETYHSCRDVMLMAFTRLFDRDRNSVNIRYLLNCVEQTPGVFPGLKDKVVLGSVDTHRKDVEGLQPLIDVVQVQRDRMLAHLDRLHVNKPAEIEALPPIPLAEVVKAFDIGYGIVDTYDRYLGSTFLLRELKPNTAADMDYLFQLIRKADGEYLVPGSM